MRATVLLVLLSLLFEATLARHVDWVPCPHSVSPSPTGKKPVITLAQQFQINIECNILQKNTSFDIIEYVDEINNKAAVFTTSSYHSVSQFYNYEKYEIFTVINGTCTTKDMRANGSYGFIGYTPGKSGGHVMSVKDLLMFGEEYNDTYVGPATVRGIPVDHWTTCVHAPAFNITVTMDYYFNRPEYKTSSGDVVPVRLAINGTSPNTRDPSGKLQPGSHEFRHNYEFIYYKPGAMDPTIFQTPKGVVCPGRINIKSLPNITDQFTLDGETVHQSSKSVDMIKEFYDFSAKMFRFDRKLKHSTRRWNRNMTAKYGAANLKFIHDYNAGLEYVIDKEKGNCTIHPIPLLAWDGEQMPDHHHLRMKHSYEMWEGQMFNNLNTSYEGQRMIRDIPADVWVTSFPSRWNKSHFVTSEVYFTPANWTYTVENNENETIVPVATWMKFGSGNKSYEFFMNIFEFYNGHPDEDSFDISSCYDQPKQKQGMVFRVVGNYLDLVYEKKRPLLKAVKNAIAKTANISSIRVHDIFFDQTNVNYVDVWFTLLEKPTVTGDVLNGTKDNTSLSAAKANLEKAVKNNMVITVTYDDQKIKNLKVRQGSLLTSEDALDPRVSPKYIYTTQGFTAGAMAGLGVGMIVLGLLIGAAGAFFIFRRMGGEIPYRLTE
ncbi:uncharacterized protein LOC106173269 [Lingula anatina]|uniref:Uncharacterized protein LOC106173269 n=1 Tax=Lingula anatina TaxID=7574 RepID=A0A1S3JHB7_LINAN|nr:uncharacterized protein LOC106173269 [Lingula anatina]|eukprot:XP_013409792.1 uncharacterized protein LOC106173269 [Lingula anatina]